MVDYIQKGMLIVGICLWSGWCLGQESVKEFIDKHGQAVEKQEDAVGYQMAARDAKGRLDGLVTRYDSLGRKTMSGAYVAGDQEGVFEHYYPGGQLQSKVEYQADWPVGKFEGWYENGRLEEIGHFPGNTASREGRWHWEVYRIESFWDSTGVQLVKNGTGNYYDEHDNGTVSLKGRYRDGLREGEWLFYDETGRQTNAEQYVNGRLEKGLY